MLICLEVLILLSYPTPTFSEATSTFLTAVLTFQRSPRKQQKLQQPVEATLSWWPWLSVSVFTKLRRARERGKKMRARNDFARYSSSPYAGRSGRLMPFVCAGRRARESLLGRLAEEHRWTWVPRGPTELSWSVQGPATPSHHAAPPAPETIAEMPPATTQAHTHTHTYTQNTYSCTHTQTKTHTCTCTHTQTHTHRQKRTHARAQILEHTHTYIHTLSHMRMWVALRCSSWAEHAGGEQQDVNTFDEDFNVVVRRHLLVIIHISFVIPWNLHRVAKYNIYLMIQGWKVKCVAQLTPLL